MSKLIKIHTEDNVAIALENLNQGDTVVFEGESLLILNDVKAKHKVALLDLEKNHKIYMYGVLVGRTTAAIKRGDVLTTTNVAHEASQVFKKTAVKAWTPPDVSKYKARTFMGYHRPDGQVGTKNVWLFFPLVFCENRNVALLKDIFEKELSFQKSPRQRQLLRNLINGADEDTLVEFENTKTEIFDNIEVKFITHQGGCGGIRQDAVMLAKLLAGYVNNPNVAGATVLSLGCQHLQIDIFKNALKALNPDIKKPVLIYQQQDEESVDAMLDKIIKESFKGIQKANELQRKPAPLSKLNLGLECGGSDGFSGISANPTLGYVSDLLSALGGSPILSEFPELCGVEQELVNRCIDDKTAQKFMHLMKSYEQAAEASGSGFDMNPSPGNIKDGLITDAMKSAGAAKKGGTSPIQAILDYGEYVTQPGLNLLCTPGNDVESTTGMAGSGANIIVFTTGLGTPTGNPITPVIKMASNTQLASKMPDIIDIDAGAVITGAKSIPEMGAELLDFIIEVASGTVTTKADALNQEDFIPWKRGVSL